MRKVQTYQEYLKLVEFKRQLSLNLREGKIGVDEAVIQLFTFYSFNNIEEPPFIVLKMQEAAVNGTYEAKLNMLRRFKII